MAISIDERLNQQCLQEYANNNFNLIHNSRNKLRSGVCFLTQTDLKYKIHPVFLSPSFESLVFTITFKSSMLIAVAIYRLPPSKENRSKHSTFYDEF